MTTKTKLEYREKVELEWGRNGQKESIGKKKKTYKNKEIMMAPKEYGNESQRENFFSTNAPSLLKRVLQVEFPKESPDESNNDHSLTMRLLRNPNPVPLPSVLVN